MTLEKEMETKLFQNIMEELKYVQDYTFKSLEYEANKGIQTGYYCLGYFGEKMTSLEKSVHRIESWLEMLHRGSISQPAMNYCPNCGGLAESVYAEQRYPPKAYSSEIVETIECQMCGYYSVTPLNDDEVEDIKLAIEEIDEENDEEDNEEPDEGHKDEKNPIWFQNGFPNEATWILSGWLNDQLELYEDIQEYIAEEDYEDILALGKWIRARIETYLDTTVTEKLLNEVDWRELARMLSEAN